MRLHISWTVLAATLQRFTLSFLCGLTVLALIVYANHYPSVSDQVWFLQVMLTIAVFAPLIVSSEWVGVMKGSSTIRLVGSLVTVFIACLYGFFWLPDLHNSIQNDGYMVQIVVHGLLTWGSLFWIVPAIMKSDAKDTWEHTWRLVVQTVITGVFCVVLYAGLAAAVGAVEFLFGLNIPNTLYGDIAALVFAGFGTLFWLSHFSVSRVSYSYSHESFPVVLRVFAEYILGFLLVIYAAILLAYTFKIVVSGEWPNGMVASLIFGFVGMGMVYSAILLPRIRDTAGGILRSRLLGVAFIGCAILLVAALQLRVIEYGWTVDRAFIVVIAIWIVLLAGSLLFLRHSLTLWILSGTLLAFVSIYGPVNVFSISQNDQIARLRSELSTVGITQPGQKAGSPESTKITENISSRVDYLLRYHGTGGLATFASIDTLNPQPGKDSNSAQDTWTIGTSIMSGWGLVYEPNNYRMAEEGLLRQLYFYTPNPSNVPLGGYESLFFIERYNDNNANDQASITSSVASGSNEKSSYVMDLKNLTITVSGTESISLLPLLDQGKNMQNQQQAKQMLSTPLILTGSNFMLYVTTLNGEYTQNGSSELFTLRQIQGILLVR